jgi:hypothetical protein
MTAAIIGTGGIGSAIAASSPQAARPCRSQVPTMSRHELWLQRSVELPSTPSTTAMRCRAPMPSSVRCASPL